MSGPAPRRRVLAVEDDPAIRELMRMHLALAGLHVEEVADGREALERARAEAFDLIVLDLMLPTLDGITVCRAIRTEGANRATPILMVTARDTEAYTVIGLESGADDYLAKPFDMEDLAARMVTAERVITMHRRSEAVLRLARLQGGGLAADRRDPLRCHGGAPRTRRPPSPCGCG